MREWVELFDETRPSFIKFLSYFGPFAVYQVTGLACSSRKKVRAL